MFQSQRVACFLNTFGGHGDDSESKELKLVFHVSPITPDLAIEISPKLADRLFRMMQGEWEAAKEITKASFSSINIPMQNVTFNQLPDITDQKGILVPGVAISNLRAARTESGDFRLEFDAVIPMDEMTMELVERYYKATCFLSMVPIQRELKVDDVALEVTEEQVGLQEAADDTEPVTDRKSAAAGGKSRKKGK